MPCAFCQQLWYPMYRYRYLCTMFNVGTMCILPNTTVPYVPTYRYVLCLTIEKKLFKIFGVQTFFLNWKKHSAPGSDPDMEYGSGSPPYLGVTRREPCPLPGVPLFPWQQWPPVLAWSRSNTWQKKTPLFISSVADPGCLSRIPDPDFYPLRIPNPGSKNSNKREGWKKICCQTFFCSHKFHKIENYFIFQGASFQRIIELFTQKFVTKLKKIWGWDRGSGIRDPGSGKKPIPDPGARIRVQGSKKHRIPDPDPQHCL